MQAHICMLRTYPHADISEFMEPLLKDRDRLLQDPGQLQNAINRRRREWQQLKRRRDDKESSRTHETFELLGEVAKRLDLLFVFSTSTGTLDIAILQAVVAYYRQTAERSKQAVRDKPILEPLAGLPSAGLHKNARSAQPQLPARFEVPDDKVLWAVDFDEYEPKQFTAQVVLENDRDLFELDHPPTRGWADPELPWADDVEQWKRFPELFLRELKQRVSFEAPIEFDDHGRPLNPRGRTGLAHRGLLVSGAAGPSNQLRSALMPPRPTHPVPPTPSRLRAMGHPTWQL